MEGEIKLKILVELATALDNDGRDLLATIIKGWDRNGDEATLKELITYNLEFEPTLDEEDAAYSRKFIQIQDFSLEIKDIHSLEKKRDYDELSNSIKYKIFLNEDPNNFGATKNKSFFYPNLDARDKAWGQLKRKLEVFGVIFK